MRIQCYLLILLVCNCLQVWPAYITEIVNNTDKPITIDAAFFPGACPYITKTISLETKQEIDYIKPLNSGRSLTINGMTRSLITDLNIPVVEPRLHSSGRNSYADFKYNHYICINFKGYWSSSVEPIPFIGLRMKGNLLNIRKGLGVKNVYLNENCLPHFSFSECLKRMRQKSTFTIEINQLQTISHRADHPNRWKLRDNSVDIIIKNNDIAHDELVAKHSNLCPRAYIFDIQKSEDEGLTRIVVKFDNLRDARYVVNFCSFIQKRDLVKKLARLLPLPSKFAMDDSVSFVFYGDVDINTFQSLLDEANSSFEPLVDLRTVLHRRR